MSPEGAGARPEARARLAWETAGLPYVTLERGSAGWPSSAREVAGLDRINVMGDPASLDGPLVAVVGERHLLTDAQLDWARECGRVVARSGAVLLTTCDVGSGLAAAEACLDEGGRVAVASLTGCDVAWPVDSGPVRLAAATSGGCVCSAAGLGEGPRRIHAPSRRALMRVLSDMAVCTAAEPGSALVADLFELA